MASRVWSDERLDDLAEAMRSGFARVDQDIRQLRGDINGLRRVIMTFGGGIIVGLIGVIAAVLARGA